jgi:ketosteroid isomerase-like protein
MKRRFALLAVLLAPLAAPLLMAQLPAEKLLAEQKSDTLYTATRAQLEVVKVVLAQQAAWNNGDLDGFISHYKDADDTEAMLAGPAKGMAAIRAAFRINYPNRESMGKIEYTEVEARELGERFVLATGRYHLERTKKGGGPADGNFTEVMEKTAAGWQVIFSETT